MSQTQILLVDDSKQWREKLCSLLKAVPGYEIVAEAENGLDAIQKAAQLHPEIVLLDIGMPILNGIAAAPRILLASPHSKIVFVTQEDDPDLRTAALAAGGEGYVLKSSVVSELVPVMDTLLRAWPGVASGVQHSSNDYPVRALAFD